MPVISRLSEATRAPDKGARYHYIGRLPAFGQLRRHSSRKSLLFIIAFAVARAACGCSFFAHSLSCRANSVFVAGQSPALSRSSAFGKMILAIVLGRPASPVLYSGCLAATSSLVGRTEQPTVSATTRTAPGPNEHTTKLSMTRLRGRKFHPESN